MKKILIAEDDTFLASAYKLKFSKSDFEVKIASDGQEAIDILQEFTPDMILLDLIMPKMDGFAVLDVVKKSEKWKNIPIIVTTNLGQQEDIDKAIRLGANDYVIKSDISIDGLVLKINGLISPNA